MLRRFLKLLESQKPQPLPRSLLEDIRALTRKAEANRQRELMVNDAEGEGPVRVFMNYQVNNAKIRKIERNGREHIVVPSYTLPSEVVMNGGLYPHDEIEKAYKSLEGKLAPAGHPIVNGEYVAAGTIEAINAYHVGAWNENVRREGNRIAVDKVIDVEYAQRTEKGAAILEAINKGEPIHTSTGIFMQREPVTNAKGYKWIARNMEMDHDAILLGEIGAATPAEGVGMMVNVADATELPTDISVNDKGLFDRFVKWLKMEVNSEPSTPNQPSQDADMTPEELKALLAEERKATVDAVNEAIGKPLGDRLTALESTLTANERAKETEKRTAVAAKYGDVVANQLTGDALEAMYATTQGTAPALPGMHANRQEHPGFSIPE